jgi:hypothetical protein
MKYLIVILFFATNAFAVDCSCLQEERLSDECVDWSYTDEAIKCEEPDPYVVRFEEIEARVRKLETKQRKVSSHGSKRSSF